MIEKFRGMLPNGTTLGWVCAFAAVTIWSTWAVATRFLLTNATLNAHDVVAIRFAVAAIILLPITLRGFPLRRLGVWRVLAIIAGSGAVFSLFNTGGLGYAPVAHGTAMTSPMGAVFTGTMAHFVLKERLDRRRAIGLGIVLLGALLLVSSVSMADRDGWTILKGDLYFVTAAFLWSIYTIAVRGSGMSGLQVAALSATGSTLVWSIPHVIATGGALFAAPPMELLTAGLLHGVYSGILSVLLFTLAVGLLGPSRAGVVGALNPVLGAVLGVIVLGEIPGWLQIAAIALLTGGIWLAAGARFARAQTTLAPPDARD